jgi:cation diffusion facilitator family transporter
MVTLLRRLFIKDYTNVNEESVRAAHGKLAAIFGIVSNFILVALKLTAAFIIASSSVPWVLPMALVGDAVNNLSDMTSSLVTLIGFKISAKPADKEHPFGHERIEYIAGLIVSVVVIVVAVQLFRDSLEKVIADTRVSYDLLTVIILGVSVLLKLLQSYVNRGIGKAINSGSLIATSLDSFTDAIATFSIMVSGILCLTLGWDFLDGYMGILVSLFVLYSGVKMIRETADPLIGEKGNTAIVEEVVKDVKSHKEILGVHDVICHSYGPTKYFVSLHAEIDENMKMLDAHDVIDDIENEIKKDHHVDITIHMDPVAVGDPLTDELKKEVAGILSSLASDIQFHDFRIVNGPTHVNVIFDVLMPYGEKVKDQDVIDALNKHFEKDEKPKHFVLTFDHPY